MRCWAELSWAERWPAWCDGGCLHFGMLAQRTLCRIIARSSSSCSSSHRLQLRLFPLSLSCSRYLGHTICVDGDSSNGSGNGETWTVRMNEKVSQRVQMIAIAVQLPVGWARERSQLHIRLIPLRLLFTMLHLANSRHLVRTYVRRWSYTASLIVCENIFILCEWCARWCVLRFFAPRAL